MRCDVLGVGFDPVTMDEAVSRSLAAMAERSGAYVCTPNPEIVMLARDDPALMEAVNGARLVLADGAGIAWAAKRLGRPLPARVPGCDYLMALLEKMSGSVYILGGRPGVAEGAAGTIAARYPRVTIAGCRDGYFTDEAAVLEDIREARPSLLMVCMGAPRQELFMAAHRELPVGLMAGLGGTADILAGTARRAPEAWRRRGLEWLYRLIREPRRIKRQIRLPRFAAAVRAQRKRENGKRKADRA